MSQRFEQFTSAIVRIHAPLPAVWRVLTGRTGDIFMGATFETSWQVGDPISFSGEWEGNPYRDKGEIQAFVPNKRLAFTQFSSMSGKPELPENFDLVTFTLNDEGAATAVELALGKPVGVAAPSGDMLDGLTRNLDAILNTLKQLAEQDEGAQS